MPWGDNTRNQGPWGGGGGGQTPSPVPPDIDAMLRRAKQQLEDFFKGNNGGMLIIAALLSAVMWLATGVYTVQPGEEGVVLRFGAYHHTSLPGINYHFPSPIERVIKVPVEKINTVNVGFRNFDATGGKIAKDSKVLEESLMLTVNRNIVELPFDVNWKVEDAAKFLFNVRDPSGTVKSVAESAMREVVARNKFGEIIAAGKEKIAQEAREIMQEILKGYNTGILITQLNMRDVQPPEEVVDAFIDVEDAKQDRDKAVAQAKAYENDVIPRARGDAERVLQEAHAYKETVVARARGDAGRFTAVYDKYKDAKDVTRKRIYLETMEEVLQGTNKVLLDNGSHGSNVIPYLPLSELKAKQP
jgi:modulator of FtsH protease HflK